MFFRSRLWPLLAAGVLSASAGAVQSAALNWNKGPFSSVANEKPLPDFLRELAASQGTTAVVDPKVSGFISGKFLASAQSLLTSLCSTNGLTWYHDGSFLFIELAADARTEVMSISQGSGGRITETLNRLQIADNRFPLTISEADGTLRVSGPRRYVEMVRQAVKLSDQRASSNTQAEIRVFPLRYAWASDFKTSRAGREATVSGVVSVLRGLYPNQAAGAAGKGGAAGTGSALRMGPNRMLKLSSGETVEAPKVEVGGAAAPAGGDDAAFNFSPNAELPQFHADSRMNAVVVRDLPERMAQHARLIESMDTRPLLIELELTIMDISSDTLNRLGVDWRLHSGHADFQTGNGDQSPLTFEAGQTGARTPLGGVFTATIGHAARTFLLTRVNALAKSGDANFVARPKVLTFNNTEAVLENLSELHVRVNGFQDAGLFNITAGTALRITPMLVDQGGERGVMMTINIEDADISAAQVDAIPVVRRRAVNTQAMVDEGTSLLIAGYSSEEKVNATSGVPVLSNMPVIGNVFKFTEKKQLNMERFYLLTPRLVTTRTSAAAPVPGGQSTAPPAKPEMADGAQQPAGKTATLPDDVPSSPSGGVKQEGRT